MMATACPRALLMSTPSSVGLVNIQPRQRGSLVDPRRLGLWVERSADERLTAMAGSVGATKSALMQWLIEQADVDAAGRPRGWDSDHPRAEELPLDSQ